MACVAWGAQDEGEFIDKALAWLKVVEQEPSLVDPETIRKAMNLRVLMEAHKEAANAKQEAERR